MISPADELEIRNLITRYCMTTDNADADAFMQTWVEPDEFGGYESGPFGSMKTWQEMYEFELHHVGEGGMARGKRHQATNVLIEPQDENTVHVSHDMLVIDVQNVPSIIATGRYQDSVVVRTPKGWRFKSRTLHVDPGFFELQKQWEAAAAGQ